ncbi:LysR family transcriptional regulator [Edwardsiella anguillarum]|nr:LysR family transcriptional regulator [Edwardsiella anguillarum]
MGAVWRPFIPGLQKELSKNAGNGVRRSGNRPRTDPRTDALGAAIFDRDRTGVPHPREQESRPLSLDNHWRDRVSLKMLRYFHAVASHGHFSRAAERLNVSKSPLSAQIRELESLLGAALFDRHTRQVSLTPTGHLLLAECTLLFDMLESSLNRVVQAGRRERNQIRIGLISTVFWAGFGEVIRQCHQCYPELQISFTELSPERQKQALLSRRSISASPVSPTPSIFTRCWPRASIANR